jgi:hypothetical protein
MGSFQTLHTSKYPEKPLDDSPFAILSGVGITKLFGIEVDNSGNTSDVFVKLWDAASSPTVGTTVPNAGILRVEAGKRQPFFLNGPAGLALSNNLYIVCVTTGGTGGTTAPTNAVTADIFTD